MLLPLLIAALTTLFMGMVAPQQSVLLRDLAHTSLCLTIMARAIALHRWEPIFIGCGILVITAVNALFFQAGLAAVFASLSGVLCAAVHLALSRRT